MSQNSYPAKGQLKAVKRVRNLTTVFLLVISVRKIIKSWLPITHSFIKQTASHIRCLLLRNLYQIQLDRVKVKNQTLLQILRQTALPPYPAVLIHSNLAKEIWSLFKINEISVPQTNQNYSRKIFFLVSVYLANIYTTFLR